MASAKVLCVRAQQRHLAEQRAGPASRSPTTCLQADAIELDQPSLRIRELASSPDGKGRDRAALLMVVMCSHSICAATDLEYHRQVLHLPPVVQRIHVLCLSRHRHLLRLQNGLSALDPPNRTPFRPLYSPAEGNTQPQPSAGCTGCLAHLLCCYNGAMLLSAGVNQSADGGRAIYRVKPAQPARPVPPVQTARPHRRNSHHQRHHGALGVAGLCIF